MAKASRLETVEYARKRRQGLPSRISMPRATLGWADLAKSAAK